MPALPDATAAAVQVMCIVLSADSQEVTELTCSCPVLASKLHKRCGSCCPAAARSVGSTRGAGMATPAKASWPVAAAVLPGANRAVAAAAASSTYAAPGNTILPATWWSHRKANLLLLTSTSKAVEVRLKLRISWLAGGRGQNLNLCQGRG